MKTYLRILVLVSSVALPTGAYAQQAARLAPPAVPADIRLSPSEFVPFLAAHAVGTQGYFCTAIGTSYSWMPFGPQATLFNADGQQILTHFLSPTPYSLLPAPTWQHSRDSSVVWGQVIAPSSDPAYVAPDAIPWLLLEATVVGDGPTGGDTLLKTRRIQRVNTVEGKAPATGCSQPGDIGKRALVPYEADYYFYKDKPTGRHRD
jgi:Protein of unknown function (DUF3455)